MDIVNIAGAALAMKASQGRETIAASMLKAAADQQTALADMLAKNSAQVAALQTPDPRYGFSTYA